MFIAALDTDTLWPSLRRDFLPSLAVEGLYRPVWSERTLDELEYRERRKLTDRGLAEPDAAERAEHLIGQMRHAFDDAVVIESRTRTVAPAGLPHPDDEHVLAAAFAAGAEVIVTGNQRHFPPRLLPPGLIPITPADFARDTVSVARPCARGCRADGRPPIQQPFGGCSRPARAHLRHGRGVRFAPRCDVIATAILG